MDDINRDIGAHEARLDNIEKQMAQMNEKVDKVVAYLERNKGGIQVLIAVGSVAASLAAGITEFVHWLHERAP